MNMLLRLRPTLTLRRLAWATAGIVCVGLLYVLRGDVRLVAHTELSQPSSASLRWAEPTVLFSSGALSATRLGGAVAGISYGVEGLARTEELGVATKIGSYAMYCDKPDT